MDEQIHYLIRDGEAFAKAIKETLDNIERLMKMIESDLITVVPMQK